MTTQKETLLLRGHSSKYKDKESAISITRNSFPGSAHKFLDSKTLIRTLLSVSSPSKLLSSVPVGLKENEHFIVDNSANAKKYELGLKCIYKDDSGPWNFGQSHSVTRYFLYNSLKSIELKDGLYCKETRRDKKRVYLPLDPQPTSESILSVHSYYVKHISSESYRRKVTWLGTLPKLVLPVAIYEYCGQVPKCLKNSLQSCSTEIYCSVIEDDIGEASVNCLSLVISEHPQIPEAVGGHKLSSLPQKCLEMDFMLKSMKTRNENVLKQIPRGLKENKFFIVDAERFLNDQDIETFNRGIWTDDCGPWDYENTTYEKYLILYIFNESFRFIEIIEGLYCTLQSENEYLPLAPQPNLDDLISAQKYNVCHKYAESYRRRITILKSVQGGPCTAFIEYHGSAPDQLKCDLNNAPYTANEKKCKLFSVVDPANVKDQCTLSVMAVSSCKSEFLEREMHRGFLPLHLVHKRLRESSSANNVYARVPTGLKENQQYIVTNNINVQRHLKGRKCSFLDDSGPWVSQVTRTVTYFLENGRIFKKVIKHEGLYCTEYKIDCEKMFIPLMPQPNANSVIVCHRNSARHKQSSSYRRRITWLEDGSDHLPSFAFYEYLGNAPECLKFFFTSKIDDSVQTKDMKVEDMDPQCWIKCVNGGYKLTHLYGKFLDLYEVISVLQMKSIRDKPLYTVPCGVKENQFFIVCNKENIARQKIGKKNVFWDDCGAWNASCTKTTTERYLCGPNQKLTRVLKVQGELCIERIREGNRLYIPLYPQPDSSTVIVIHRNFSKHLLSNTYQRKVTWLENNKTVFPEIACYEYVGIFPGHQPHRNSRKKSMNYVRTKRKFTCEEKNSTLSASDDLYKEMDEEITSNCLNMVSKKLKNLQNVRIEPCEDLRIGIKDRTKMMSNHIPDMVHSHPFVQVVTSSKGKMMSVLMYIDDQLLDLKRFCCYSEVNEITILSFSSIHDFCGLTLTYSVFKNLSVFRNDSRQCPLFPGPFFLHEKSDLTSYATFFVHLASRLGRNSPLIIISEEEEMLKSFIQAFPNGLSLFSFQCLQKEFLHFLKRVEVFQPEKRNLLRKLVFGEEGIVNANNVDIFTDLVEKVHNICNEISTDVGSYFKIHLFPILKNNFDLIQKFNIPLSMVKLSGLSCNTLKNSAKIDKVIIEENCIEQVIESLHNVVNIFYSELKISLHGQGEFNLCHEYKKFFRNASVSHMDEFARLKNFQDFMVTPKPRKKFKI